MRKPTITAAIISAGAVIVAALIGIIPSLRKQQANPAPKPVIAGMVVDQDSKGIGQAAIVIVGRTEQSTTEDSGNFRIELPSEAPKSLRLHVVKQGFLPWDNSVVPGENIMIRLQRQ